MRRQATELLDPLIRPIGREADLLDLKFRYYLETCRRDFSGAPRAGASRFWFVVWEFRAQIEWGDDKVEPSSVGQPDAPDCRGTWIELYERTRSIADALERFEDTARANDVPPRYVDDLLATHRLTGWRQSSLRRRR